MSHCLVNVLLVTLHVGHDCFETFCDSGPRPNEETRKCGQGQLGVKYEKAFHYNRKLSEPAFFFLFFLHSFKVL